MSSSKKISLLSAIFINLNVMIGTGIFINTFDLASKTGAAGFLLYPIIGACMLPLIAVFGKLIGYFPTGGLYAFGKSSSSYLGFFSCWSYFFGKLASCAVMLSVGAAMIQQLIPATQAIDTITFTFIILLIFTFLNLQNMKVGLTVQTFFLTAKSIPIIFAIIAGIILFDTSGITTNSFIWEGLPISIPLILYCLAGFETACALSRNIENPAVNGPKAVYYSFGIIMLLYGIFQGLIYMSVYSSMINIHSYKDVFPCIAHKLFNSEFIANKLSVILSFSIGASALGGAYGILFSNPWNLYMLAENNHIIGSTTILKLNKHQTPWIAVLIEALICTLFLLSNQTSPLPLRRTAALGIVIAYTVSAFAYFNILKKNRASTQEFMLALAAFVSCILFITSCAMSFIQEGIAPLLLFIAILTIGTAMFMYQEKIKQA